MAFNIALENVQYNILDRFPIEDVELKWNQVPVDVYTGKDLYEFSLMNVSTGSFLEIRSTGWYKHVSIHGVLLRVYTRRSLQIK